MQDVLEFILKNIVTSPSDIQVSAADEGGVTHYTIAVHPDDVGRVIGKEGKVIKAIRTILRVIAIQQGVRVRVSVLSENGGETTEDDVVTVEEAPAPVEPASPETTEPDSLTVEV